jgi:hypothetical protein
MNWINIHTDLLRSPEYIGAEPVERATWFALLAWCCSQENSGRIEGGASWSDRKWQQLCGVTRDEVHMPSELYRVDGDDIIVEHYPEDKEAEVRGKRTGGAKGGRAKTQAKTQAARSNGTKGGRPKSAGNKGDPNQKPKEEPKENPSTTEAETQRKEKGKGKEKGREVPPKPPEGEPEGGGTTRPTLEQAREGAVMIGVDPDLAEEWWNCREASDWTKGAGGGGTVTVGRNWQADLKTYANRMGKSDHRAEKAKREFAEEPMEIPTYGK